MSASSRIALHVTPRSGRDVVCGVKAGCDGLSEVRIKVTAPPDNGKANAAVCKLLARSLGVPKSSINVVRGATSRHKVVEVPLDAKAVQAWLDGLQQL